MFEQIESHDFILAVIFPGINFSILSVYFSWYGSDHHETTRMQLDHTGPLLFPADDRVLIPAWLTLKRFWPPSYRNIQNDTDGVVARLQAFYSRKQILNCNICCELSSCKYGQFYMETAWVGRIFTPIRPIAAKYYWLGLVKSALLSSQGKRWFFNKKTVCWLDLRWLEPAGWPLSLVFGIDSLILWLEGS